ncbi:MAG: hypothetical protein ACREKR_05285 [Candidatus Methylomirabilales bacterium]
MQQETTRHFVTASRGKIIPQQALCTATTLFLTGWIMAGCAARHLVGSPIKEEGIHKIVAGKTTRAEILSVFGPPYRVESKGDQEVLTYFYGKQSHWTILLYSESRQSADILNVYLNQNGIVSNYAFSEGVAMPERDFPTRPLALRH